MLSVKATKGQEEKKLLRYRERDHEARMTYYRMLRELVRIYGMESLVFIDETGFEKFSCLIYGWAKRGRRIYGERQGRRCKRENLVAGRRKYRKELIAPMLFEGSLDAVTFEKWLELYLLPALTRVSVLIMDNAPIHRKNRIKELVERAGHIVLFLPTYSPDLNDIEHDFSALKRLRMYAPVGTTLDEVIRNYCIS